MKGKLIIKAKVNERDFIEHLLNMKHSNVLDKYLVLCLSFHAMANSWKYDKVIYYLSLLEITQT